jgi:hypothetical protein
LASAGEKEMKIGEDDEAQADEESSIDIERGRDIILVKAGDMLLVAGLGWWWQHAKAGEAGMYCVRRKEKPKPPLPALGTTQGSRLPTFHIHVFQVVMDSSSPSFVPGCF